VGAAVVATIAILAFRLARDAFFDDGIIQAGRIDAVTVAMSALAAAALAGAKVPTPIVVLAAAVVGVLRG
jgi:chromate transport protein ChrA